jgi:hypothetical protein
MQIQRKLHAWLSCAMTFAVLLTGIGGAASSTANANDHKSNAVPTGFASIASPTVLGPFPANALPGDSSRDYPFHTDANLAAVGYVEQEFFFEGVAKLYETAPLATGRVIDADGKPYRTRMLVRRPASDKKFNGTVIVEWLNVTAGYDLEVMWLNSREHLIREGYAWVGVDVQRVGVHGSTIPLTAGKGLKDWSPQRYASLDLTAGGTVMNDGLEHDVLSQAAKAVRFPSGVAPLGNLRIRQMIAAGSSQSAGRLVPYINSIHPLAPVFEGFLLHIGGGRVRTDIPEKIFKLITETDVPGQAAARQADTATFRMWEIAGTSHADYPTFLANEQQYTRDFGPRAPVVCDVMPAYSRIPAYQVLNAVFEHMVKWIASDVQPPSAEPIVLASSGPPAVIARDSAGFAQGGIRLSQLTVPTALNRGDNSGSAFCRLYGSSTPFDQATLKQLYPTRGAYVSAVTQASQDNVQQGYIVREDAQANIKIATEQARTW